jgi:hypothetical protein
MHALVGQSGAADRDVERRRRRLRVISVAAAGVMVEDGRRGCPHGHDRRLAELRLANHQRPVVVIEVATIEPDRLTDAHHRWPGAIRVGPCGWLR